MAVLRETARRLDLRRFCETYPVPGLMVSPADPAQSSQAGEDGARHLLTLNIGSAKALRYQDRCGFLTKRPGNPFPRMISLGRAANSDLVVAVDSVSKFHGSFTGAGEEWSFTDEESTNGSRVNGRELEPRRKRELKDGDVLLFGLEVQAVFFLPASLHAHLSR